MERGRKCENDQGIVKRKTPRISKIDQRRGQGEIERKRRERRAKIEEAMIRQANVGYGG